MKMEQFRRVGEIDSDLHGDIYTFVITKKWKGGATREVQSEGPRAGQDAVLGEQDDVI
jgi:hypothetical protein